MPAEQFNVRLRWGLGRQVRIRAAELGVRERDVIEDALEIAGFQKLTSEGEPGPNQLRLSSPERVDIASNGGRLDQPAAVTPQTDAAHRDDDERSRRRLESGEQRAADARTPRQRSGRKDRADKGAEGAKSRNPRSRPDRRPGASGRANVEPARAAGLSGCPECGGNMTTHDDWPGILVCADCGNRQETPND